jgi:hypothetical protein
MPVNPTTTPIAKHTSVSTGSSMDSPTIYRLADTGPAEPIARARCVVRYETAREASRTRAQ